MAFIGMPLNAPNQWVKVQGVTGQYILCEDEQRVDPRSIKAFIIAYSNGEVFDWEQPFFPWPEGIHEPKRMRRVADTITLDELRDSERFARVTHGTSNMPKAAKHYYATTLSNQTDQRIQVLRFAGYTHIGRGIYQVHTITGGYFTAEQFRAWYGLDERTWIEPGQSATDPENYGEPGALWVYFCQTESGEEFAAGCIAR